MTIIVICVIALSLSLFLALISLSTLIRGVQDRFSLRLLVKLEGVITHTIEADVTTILGLLTARRRELTRNRLTPLRSEACRPLLLYFLFYLALLFEATADADDYHEADHGAYWSCYVDPKKINLWTDNCDLL